MSRIKESMRLYNRSLQLIKENKKKAFNVAITAWFIIKKEKKDAFYFTLSLYTCELGYELGLYGQALEVAKLSIKHIDECPTSKDKIITIHDSLLNKRTKERATHNYKIIKEYSIDEIFSIIGSGNTFEYKGHHYFQDGDYKVKLRRATIYKKIGVDCVCCDTKASHFALGIDKGNHYHLDLYGYDKDGALTMITIDHIHPRCKGGEDKVDNYQPMCKVCNENKGGYYDNDKSIQ